jgi:adenine-specific DNA-methyltransferase
MPRPRGTGGKPPKRPIEQYEHKNKQRMNNPPAGLVTAETDPPLPTHKTYDYLTPVPSVPIGRTGMSDPHKSASAKYDYDPHLDPQLVWAGKKEHTSFDVHTVSLHVHERIDPSTIIEAVRRRNGNGHAEQPSLFERREENPPLRDAVDFYRHPHGWSNRLIAGDSLLVMNSLLEKEGMAGQVQMVYIDPPYGKTYNSNFQPFVNKRDVTDGRDEDLTQEPEMIRAFRDTWELDIHSYLTYLRDRLLLARDLLHESGSCFVQISDLNLHFARNLMDDIFHRDNFVSCVAYTTTGGFPSKTLSRAGDYLVWYAKDIATLKYRPLFTSKPSPIGDPKSKYDQIEEDSGRRRSLAAEEKSGDKALAKTAKIYRLDNLQSQGSASEDTPFEFEERVHKPKADSHWKAHYPDGMERLRVARRLQASENILNYIRYFDDFSKAPINNLWHDIGGSVQSRSDPKVFVVQTGTPVIQRCLLMTTDPGDLVLDPTCGSGTTAYVAEQWGRRWITCDTSRVAVTLAKQRLMAADFDYYELAHPQEGVGSGFRYKTVPHVTLKSIANNPEIREGMTREQIDSAIARYADQETLYDQPYIDKSRIRVTGPFTVEAVPAPTVKSLDDVEVGESKSPLYLDQERRDKGGAPSEVEMKNSQEIEIKNTEGAPSLSRSLRQGGDVDVLSDTNVRPTQASLSDFRHAATPLLDASISRSGPTLRHEEWRDELLKTGLRGKGGHHIDFSRVEPLAGTRWLHADAETKGKAAERVVISFGNEYSPLDPRQVELAWEEARTLSPKPAILVFAAFEFDPEAAKDIDGMTKEKMGMTFLTAQMNADLLTEDLKKKRASNQSFWLVGRPDVDLRHITTGEHKGKFEVEVRGFDYYNTRTGTIDSGDTSRIAMWLFDPDYDGRSLFPRQVFFPMADEDGGWARLAKNLKAEIDSELIEAYRGTVSLPFEAGQFKRVAVKVIDDRGIESLKVVDIK